jgi:hypothetical protein
MLNELSSFPVTLKLSSPVNLSPDRPCYDRNSWRVKEVEGIARHLLIVLAVRRESRVLKYPERELPLEELEAFDFGDDDDDWFTAMRCRNPDFKHATDKYVDSIHIADGVEAELDAEAIGLRYNWGNKKKKWKSYNTAVLCVVMADRVLQLGFTDTTRIAAEMLWDTAVSIHRELCDDAKKAVPVNGKQPAMPPPIDKVNRSKLFRDLGIKQLFESGIKQMNLASSPAPQPQQPRRFLVRMRIVRWLWAVLVERSNAPATSTQDCGLSSRFHWKR